MNSLQSTMLSKPLPLSEATPNSAFRVETPSKDPGKVSKDFESVFTSMLLKEMRNSLEPGSLFSEDTSDIYGGMFDQHLGQHMVDAGGIGLAKMVREALERSAGVQPLPAQTEKTSATVANAIAPSI